MVNNIFKIKLYFKVLLFSEIKDIRTFMALHDLFVPGPIAVDENDTETILKKKKSRKPSCKDSLHSTLLVCDFKENVKEQVDKLANRQKKKKLPFHPIITITLDENEQPRQYCVFVNHIYMSVPSFLHALTAYMQSFFVFNLHFPREGVKVCQFLQELFFGIKSHNAYIETFIGDMLDDLNLNSEL